MKLVKQIDFSKTYIKKLHNNFTIFNFILQLNIYNYENYHIQKQYYLLIDTIGNKIFIH